MPESREIAWAKGGGQLQPVLADATFQRRHPGQEFMEQIIAIAQGCLMGNGRRKFKTETKRIRRLCVPARHNLRFWQRVQRGVAFHTVKVAGILFKTGDAKTHPLRVRPLRQTYVDHKALTISSVLRTRAIRGKMCVRLF